MLETDSSWTNKLNTVLMQETPGETLGEIYDDLMYLQAHWYETKRPLPSASVFGSFSDALARNPNTPERVLRDILETQNTSGIRAALASNRSASSSVLAELWEKDQTFLFLFASNPNTPEHILSEIAKNRNDSLRKKVVKNPSCPLPVLVGFLDDIIMREGAQKALQALPQFSGYPLEWVIASVKGGDDDK